MPWSALAVTAEQAALAEAVRGFAHSASLVKESRAAAESDAEALPASWSLLAKQELLALPFDAELVDVCVAVDALGAALAAGPIVPTLVVARLAAAAGDDATRALVESGLRDGSFSASVDVGGLLVGGTAVTHVLTRVGEELCLVDVASLDAEPKPGLDRSRAVAVVSTGASVHAVAGGVPGVTDEEVRRLVAVLLAAESAGVAAWCLETAVDYAKVREQFGKPIGAFQAIKHRCARMLAEVELARAAVWDAAGAYDDDADVDTRRLVTAVAASTALQAAVDNAKSLVQVLGGIGYTWEHDAHLYLKRAIANRQLMGGTTTWHREAVQLARGGVRRSRHLHLGPDAEPVRAEVREFLDGVQSLDAAERRKAIADAGYLVPHWPKPYGRAAGPIEQLVIDEEFARAGVDRPDLIIGNWALPTILEHGTDDQRSRFVPPTLYGEITWCQMFSEPGAGSDLASLQTKAVRVDGGWSLSGQKVWTSQARSAHWAICLARTSSGGDKHEGITYFLVDMKTPGLDVRPLRELTGHAMFNEIFLTDVFVPDECVVGEVGGGWRLARTTLANERVAMSSGSAFPSGIEQLLEALDAHEAAEDDAALVAVGELVCRAQADVMLGVRATLARVSGTDPGAASSVRKLVGMHLRQDASELSLSLLGPRAAAGGDAATAALQRFLGTRALTIAGGTSEVLHNVIAERILGLPRG
ncbi:MAG TPA: acyl-CoA dehydrogenase family protein [Mycobacteriales bacterium]|nr:acyl-CoA dehydrogenase family protein [Mycobacteriales bacterium]